MKKQTKLLAVITTAATLAMASTVTSLANTGWVDVQKKWYYYDDAGNSIRNQWVQNGDNLYWLKDNGEMAIQMWVNDNGTYYWVNAQGARVANTWIQRAKSWFYVGEDGKMLSNTFFDKDGATYYATDTGAIATGWVEVDGIWHYFDSRNGRMAKGATIDGYYVDGAGNYIG